MSIWLTIESRNRIILRKMHGPCFMQATELGSSDTSEIHGSTTLVGPLVVGDRRR